MAYASDVFAAGATLSERFNALRAGWTDRRARARRYRETLNELQALSDRDLADLGIYRGNVPRIAYMAAYGDN